MVTKKFPKPIFVHNKLDDAELDVYEFRVLGHVARRGKCYAALPTIAKICKMSVRKAQTSLKSLVEKEILQKHSRPGRTAVYAINEKWETEGYLAQQHSKNTEEKLIDEEDLSDIPLSLNDIVSISHNQ